MRTNYSFLWQHMEPNRLLPILVDKLLITETAKKEAESYTQKFAQNAVIIGQLFKSDCPPLKLCDTLDVTGQEHIAKKLLQGTHCIVCIYQRYRLLGVCVYTCKGNQPQHMTATRKEQNSNSPPTRHLCVAPCVRHMFISAVDLAFLIVSNLMRWMMVEHA